MNLYAKVKGKIVCYQAYDDADQIEESRQVAAELIKMEHGVDALVLCVVPKG